MLILRAARVAITCSWSTPTARNTSTAPTPSFTYYPDLLNDVRNRTTTACPQEHTFEVMRLAILAQQTAELRGYAE